MRLVIGGAAKDRDFDPDHYVAIATLIPELILAPTIQGEIYNGS